LLALVTLLIVGCGSGSDASTSSGASSSGDCGVVKDSGAPVDDGTWSGGATEIPMKVKTTADGTLRFSVQVQVGDAPPFAALLDTGSAGLRVLPGTVPDDAYESISSEDVVASFHSGIGVAGVVALARVTLGDRATLSPIPVMRITTVGCTKISTYCEAEGNDRDAFDGFGAILGVGMRSGSCSRIGNPIAQLRGHPSYIVKAPAFGGTSGTLELGPPESETASYGTIDLQQDAELSNLPDGTLSFHDDQVPVCLRDETSGASFCSGGMLDTGSPETQVEWPSFTDSMTLPPGDRVSVTIGKKSPPAATYAFTIGADPKPGLDEVVVEGADGDASVVNLGTAVFFRQSVWFDQPHGRIGLTPR
jgi:hypothetical protein